MEPVVTHPWDVSPDEAKAIQRQLQEHLIIEPVEPAPEIVAGVDVSAKGDQARAAVVLLTYPDLIPFQSVTATKPITFPYMPGLLAFREGPVVLEALEQVAEQPDVIIFDAQGLAHPRRMGLATHLGILLDAPAVGCAKSRLIGTHESPDQAKGSWTPLIDGGETIGAVVRTRENVSPVFVSLGHRVDLESSIDLVLSCAPRYRLPETTRWADRVAGSAKVRQDFLNMTPRHNTQREETRNGVTETSKHTPT